MTKTNKIMKNKWVGRKLHQFLLWLMNGYRYCCLISFLLLGLLCLKDGNFGILSFISLVPLCIYLAKSKNRTQREFVRSFYIGGVILGAFSFLYMMQAIPDFWMHDLNSAVSFMSRLLSLVVVSTFTGLPVSFIGYCLYRINYQYRIVSLILLWPIMEYIKSASVAFISYGPGGSFVPSLNFGSLAVSASGTPLVYITRFVGFYGLTAVTVLVNVLIFYVISGKNKVYRFGSLALLVIVACVNTGAWQKGRLSGPTKTLNVAITHLNNLEDANNIKDWSELKNSTDILVLPEYSYFSDSADFVSTTNKLSDKGAAITSVSTHKDRMNYNELVYYDRQGNVISKQTKTFLIPGGEYMPQILRTFLVISGKPDTLSDFDLTQLITAGTIPEKMVALDNNVRVGALPCSGVLKYTKYKQLSDEGANVLVNSASLSFLEPNSLYHVYGHNMARLQAVMNNKPFIQASRSGESYVIDNQGRFIVKSAGQKSQLIQTQINIKL